MKTSKNKVEIEKAIADQQAEIQRIKAEIAAEREAIREGSKIEMAEARELAKVQNAEKREFAKLENEKAKLQKVAEKAAQNLANFKLAVSIRIELHTKVSFSEYRANSDTAETITGKVVNYGNFRNHHTMYVVKAGTKTYQKAFNSLTVVS